MRITELTVTTEAQNTDYLAIDDSTLGTRKILPEDLVNGVLNGKYVAYEVQTVTTEEQANARYNLGIGLATTESEGLVQLYDGVDSTSTTKAATAAAVKLAYEHGGGGGSGPITIYTSVTDLSLTAGSATVSGIWSAMSAESMLLCEVTELSSGERPFSSAAGTLQVYKKGSTSGFVLIQGKKDSDGDWRMFINSNGVPSGTWNTAQPTIETGTANTTIGGGSYSDTPVLYTKTFYSVPQVFLAIVSDSTAVSDYAAITVAVKTGTKSKTGFTIRGYNAGSQSRAPAVAWVAIAY